MTMPLQNALIALGSNLEAPSYQVQQALNYLRQNPDIQFLGCSKMFKTAPEGYLDQPWFINAVCWIQTSLTPNALLATLMDIEQDMGRTRNPDIRFGPRIIDLDLLMYANEQIETPILTIPHPRMHEREFVLKPLYDLLSQHPNLTHWVETHLNEATKIAVLN